MGRPRNNVATVTLTLSTTERVKEYLEQLVAGGLFGKNAAEAAERLVARSVEGLLRDGSLGPISRGPKQSLKRGRKLG
jgi:hypothetical protein